jgi:hypothetical protein
MERVEGALTPYEVYCFRCRVTFPVEARQCLHCGGPLFGPASEPRVRPRVAAPRGGRRRHGETTRPAGALRRFGGLAIWAIVAHSRRVPDLCHAGNG